MKITQSRQIRRLRLTMIAFLLAVSLPTIVLVVKSFEQLKWEAYYQHRQVAEDLAQRIDQRLSAVLQREETRPFGDYGFVQIEANSDENYLRRSSISNFPLQSDFPGLVGYFQLDPDGIISTPFMPGSNKVAEQYGISKTELNSRAELELKLVQILSSNNLLASKPSVADPTLMEQRAPSVLYRTELDRAKSVIDPQRRPERSSSLPNDVFQDESVANQEQSESDFAFENQGLSQAAFDEISKQNAAPALKRQRDVSKASRQSSVEELELKSPYREKIAQRKESMKKARPRSDMLVKTGKAGAHAENKNELLISKQNDRRKLSLEPGLVEKNNDIILGATTQAFSSSEIKIFENEIDPFELTLLDSGHWVLFRKVWREGQRYIQGMLVEQDQFLNAVFKQQYDDSLVSSMSKLAVVYQGNVLSAYENSGRRYPLSNERSLNGTLLYRSKMSTPFNELEGLYTIRRLPAGAGSNVIWWATWVLALVLLLGTYLLYRLSFKNFNLVAQQQNFVSAVSHELKTPLTSIRMYGEILKSGWADEEKKASYYGFIFDESERLTRLINNILALARMTRNETKPNYRVITVAELFDVIRSKVDSQISTAGFTLQLSSSEEVGQIKLNLDQDLFIQIIINLVDNALKFSVNATRKEIEITAQMLSNSKVSFAVRDYGPGIEQSQMKKIFELFYRTESELTRETSGTGIGLALVNQYTRLMNGKIDVINEQQGAIFKLSFKIIE